MNKTQCGPLGAAPSLLQVGLTVDFAALRELFTVNTWGPLLKNH